MVKIPGSHETVVNNRLNAAFSRYINDAYDNDEFDLPAVEVVGDIADHIDSEGQLGFAVVRRQLGDAAITETLQAQPGLFGDGSNNTIRVDDDLTVVENGHNILILQDGQEMKIVTEGESIRYIKGDQSITLGDMLDTTQTNKFLTNLRKDLGIEDENGKS